MMTRPPVGVSGSRAVCWCHGDPGVGVVSLLTEPDTLRANFMNIYVGNLPYSVRDQDLMTLFSEYGSVSSAKVIIDRETDRSKGFGFVEMSSADEGSNAINKLNGFEFAGRELRVNEARPREERPRTGGGGGYGGRGGGGGGGGGYGGGGGGGYGGAGGGGDGGNGGERRPRRW